MESYILHIYRKDTEPLSEECRRKTDQQCMVGVLELVKSEQRLAFHSADELWALLGKTEGKLSG